MAPRSYILRDAMKLFYQLSISEQDSAIEHCAQLISVNALNNDLKIEDSEDENGQMLKVHIQSLMESMRENNFSTQEEKLNFLMEDQVFCDTVMDLAHEMAQNAFYHDDDELVIFTGNLAEISDKNSSKNEEYEDDHILTAEDLVKKWNVN